MSNKTTLTRITGNQALPLNDNMDKIEAEFNNSLSRDGSTPNQMESDLDMNSNHILNIPDPTKNNHVANKEYVDKTLSEFTKILDQKTLDLLVNLDKEVQDYQNAMDALLESGVGSLGTPITKWTVDHEGIVAAEADNTVEYVNLLGNTITTTLNESQITKKYFNGVLYVNNVLSNSSQYRTESPISSREITKPWTKSPKRAWSGTSGLWVGTSIPHQLVTTQSYPSLVAQGLNATVTNNAWSGSHLTFDPNADPNVSSSVRALTMTDADLAAELAIHGAGSVYSDTHDVVTISSEMTLEHRVIEPIISSPVDWVVCDHNHNDRYVAPGTLTPPQYTISGVTKGTTTSITVTDATGLAVGDGIALKELTGIDHLKYAVGRVTSISTNTITIELNSSSFSGTFSSGTLVKLDRSTLWGAMDFFAYAVWNATLRGGQTTLPPIIWNSAPSEYTNTSDYPGSQSIQSNANYLYEWVVSRNQLIEDGSLPFPYHTFYDQLSSLDIKEKDQLIWLPDGVHPTDGDATRMFANHWLQWMLGGAARHYDESEVLLTGSSPEPVDQYPIIYSNFYQGYGVPEWSEGPSSTVKTEDFTDITDWSANVGSAVSGSSPWGVGDSLNVSISNSVSQQYLQLDHVFNDLISVEFDLYLPSVDTAVASGVATIVIFSVDTGNTGQFQVQLLARASGTSIRGAVLPDTGGGWKYTEQIPLTAATKHRVKLDTINQNLPNYYGGLFLSLDSPVKGPILRFDNSTRTSNTRIRVGSSFSNVANPFNFSIGNLTIIEKTVTPWSSTIGNLGSGGGSTSLGGLTDVVISSPSNNQILSYNSAQSRWENTTSSASSQGITSLSGYSDLYSLISPTDGDTYHVKGLRGDNSVFVFDSSDLSSEITADEINFGSGDGGVYVAPSNDRTGASGAFVRQTNTEAKPEWWGAVADGTTSDANAINSAIQHLKTKGGGEVILEGRTYAIDQTLLIDGDNISLRGRGSTFTQGSVVELRADAETRIIWTPLSSTGPMVRHTSVAGGYAIVGGGVQDLMLDGGNVVDTCLKIQSIRNATYRNIYAFAATTVGYHVGTITGTLAADPYDVQHCHFDKVYYDIKNQPNNSSDGIHLTGGYAENYTHRGNTSFNFFSNCYFHTDSGDSVVLEDTDNNYFYLLRATSASGEGLVLGSEDQDSSGRGDESRFNHFYGGEFSSVRAKASTLGTKHSRYNSIYGWNSSNGATYPVVETGAQLQIYGRYGIENAGLIKPAVGNTTASVETAKSKMSTESLGIENGASNHIRLFGAVNDWAINVSNSSGNLRAQRSGSGSGEIEVSTSINSTLGYKVSGAYLNLSHLSDVSTFGASSGQVLGFNGSTWTPTTVSGGGGTNNPEQPSVTSVQSDLIPSSLGSATQTIVGVDSSFNTDYSVTASRIEDNFASLVNDINDLKAWARTIQTRLQGADIIA